tara:strand:- start:921 stop:1115 length:195 start_codon:yes stop_codon:yes gene_type:complete
LIADRTFIQRTAPIIGDRAIGEGATHDLRGEPKLVSELAAAVRAEESADRRRTDAMPVRYLGLR